MYSRVTLLELDTLRIGVEEAAELFATDVLPRLRLEDGFEGVLVLATPDGKGMIVTFWENEHEAADASGFAAGELDRHVALFKAQPGREYYRVAFAELPAVTVG